MSVNDASRLAARWPKTPASERVLVAIGQAGAGVATWRQLGNLLSPRFDMVAYRPPGRERRIRDPSDWSITVLAQEVCEVIESFVGRQATYMLVGACFGAAVALEVACRRSARRDNRMRGLVVIDQDAPSDVAGSATNICQLPEDAFRSYVVENKWLPQEIVEDIEAYQIYERILRRDLSALASYHAPTDSLDCDVHLVTTGDTAKPFAAHEAWQRATSGNCYLVKLGGAKLPHISQPAALARVLERIWMEGSS